MRLPIQIPLWIPPKAAKDWMVNKPKHEDLWHSQIVWWNSDGALQKLDFKMWGENYLRNDKLGKTQRNKQVK